MCDSPLQNARIVLLSDSKWMGTGTPICLTQILPLRPMKFPMTAMLLTPIPIVSQDKTESRHHRRQILYEHSQKTLKAIVCCVGNDSANSFGDSRGTYCRYLWKTIVSLMVHCMIAHSTCTLQKQRNKNKNECSLSRSYRYCIPEAGM